MLKNQNKLIENITRHIISLLYENVGGVRYKNRGDSFYTQEKNIVDELSNYDLSGKVIYCNCDNPTMSNFYKFFRKNFNVLGLKLLYATYFGENPKLYIFNGSQEKSFPIQSGRFQDNARIMQRCDIVITNPPFSDGMPKELVNMARQMGKHIIMVGPLSMAYQNEMFELIKNGQLNMGYTTINNYNRPNGSNKKNSNAPTAWWTTMETNKPMFRTGSKYIESQFPTYDNYPNIIHISDYRKMPDDYNGLMGLSPRFLRMLNRNQFEIVGKIRPVLNGKNMMEQYVIRRKSYQQQLSQVAESITNGVIMRIDESRKNCSISRT